jgi:uncharacterized membrane protein YtjA (UPF0391 family)
VTAGKLLKSRIGVTHWQHSIKYRARLLLTQEPPRQLVRYACEQVEREVEMGNLLYWAVVFLIVAIVGAALGFGGVAGTAMEGARLLFWVAIVLFVISAVAHFLRGRRL